MDVAAYDDLPRLTGTRLRHAWDVWGAGDRLGTMNRVTEGTVLRALGVPRTGRRVNLSLPLDQPGRPLFGRAHFEHRIFDRDRNTVEERITSLDPQSSSQWDSLRHVRAAADGHYGGVAADDPDAAELGVHTLAEHGLVLRGVLLDLVAYWTAVGDPVDPLVSRSITVGELTGAAACQGVMFHPGDLLLVRTGWLTAHRRRGSHDDAALRMPPGVGLAATESMARFLWDEGFCAVAADNPAVEVTPGDPAVGSLHRRLLPALGMPLGELWNLDGLAAACGESGRYEVCVVSVPLNVPGGVGSPANAMAIL